MLMKKEREKRTKKWIISTLKGIGLVVALWLINTFIAFVPFSVESNTRLIILTWIVVDAIFIYILAKTKKIGKRVIIPALLFVVFLIMLYFVPVNSNFPAEAINLNNEISANHENKYDYAEELFFAVERKYTSPIRQYLLEPWKVFLIKDFEYFWNLEEGVYADSNVQGKMYRNLLLASERFSKEEVIEHQSFCSNSPHLLIKLEHPEKGDVWVDFWAVDNFPGVESNKTYYFGMRTIRPCDDLIGNPY